MKGSVVKRAAKLGFQAVIGSSRRFSIYKRLAFSFLIIILIPNLIIGYYSFTISSGEMDRNISKGTGQVLKNVVSTINGKLMVYENLAASISSNDRLRQLLAKCREIGQSENGGEELEKQLEACRMEIGGILYQKASTVDISNLEILTDKEEFTQLDYSGKIRGGRLWDPASYRKKEIFQKAVDANGASFWADTSRDIGVFGYEDSPTSNIANYITLLRSIPDIGQNTPFGVIVITIPVWIFDGMTDFRNMYAENEVVLLTGRGGIVSILNENYIISRMPDPEVLEEIHALRRGTITRKVSDSDTILIFDSFGKMDMSVVYSVEKEQIYSGVYLVRNIIFEVSAICILCALLLSYFVTASISIPMNKLKKTMEEVQENGLELEYKDDRQDEIGVLGYRFNRMLSRIRSLLDTILQAELLRKNEEIRRKEAELDALQMQINPHFLYNTLDLIRCNAMLEEDGEGKISRMILAFSNLLRFNTIKANKLVDIEEEIGHIHAYVNVLRHIKKLDIAVEFEIEDPALRANQITKLTFQPIIENAIKHGLTDMNSKGAIRIRIRICREPGEVYIEIRDNGAGIPEERLNSLNAGLEKGVLPGKSIGLRNVNERIRLFFGEIYGLRLLSVEGEYTAVIIRIPDGGKLLIDRYFC